MTCVKSKDELIQKGSFYSPPNFKLKEERLMFDFGSLCIVLLTTGVFSCQRTWVGEERTEGKAKINKIWC